jgi:acyl carrier protein
MATGSQDPQFKLELKQLILKACNKDLAPESLADDATLVGFGSTLELDSLDVLQVNVALTQKYDVRIQDSKQARRVMKSINALADFIRPV